MRYLKSEGKISKSDCHVYEAQIDFIEESGSRWYSKIVVYADTKQEAKDIRKKIIKTLNKSNPEEETQ